MKSQRELYISTAETPQDFEDAKALFLSYAEQLNFDLSFQDFTAELENLNIQYAIPSGVLRLAHNYKNEIIGCFGIRMNDDKNCELKRMYISPQFRGKGFGNDLMKDAIIQGWRLGYERMRLDTIPTMLAAIELYKRFGFYEIDPYRHNPMKGAFYFEKDLL